MGRGEAILSKRVQMNIDRRTSPWMAGIIKDKKTNNNKKTNNDDTKSITLAEPPIFMCGVPTVWKYDVSLPTAAWRRKILSVFLLEKSTSLGRRDLCCVQMERPSEPPLAPEAAQRERRLPSRLYAARVGQRNGSDRPAQWPERLALAERNGARRTASCAALDSSRAGRWSPSERWMPGWSRTSSALVSFWR